MRINEPVTQREYAVAPYETLLSTTDLKGRIPYANDAFIRISGFDREELYGKACNLVRHPGQVAGYLSVRTRAEDEEVGAIRDHMQGIAGTMADVRSASGSQAQGVEQIREGGHG